MLGHELAGWGARQRFWPPVVAANGMPFQTVMSFQLARLPLGVLLKAGYPCTLPYFVSMTVSYNAADEFGIKLERTAAEASSLERLENERLSVMT